MCGIGGFVGFKDDGLIKEFSQLMQHRGPDGEGYYFSDNVTLLNRRLAIIDIKGGNQPIYNEDKTVVVVYNGEIYNFNELREELSLKGHIFTTKSDTEILVHGWEEWGKNCFDRLNGMFAVALYDVKKNTVVLARDHFGIKPLYFAQPKKGEYLFSSELKPLIYSKKIKTFPNDRVIYRYLRYRIHDDGRDTFFGNIYRLLPGELAEIKNGTLHIYKFTHLEEKLRELSQTYQEKNLTRKDIEEFSDLLTDSVKRRLVSEVPVGTCLSGGLDSSAIVAIVNRLLQKKAEESKSIGSVQKTFSAVFPGSGNDEEKYIDALLATSKDIKDYKVQPNADTFVKEIADFIKTQEEPTISTGPYAQYKVMQKAHEQVTVLLDGQGSDEIMAGYLPYYFVYLKQLFFKKKYKDLICEAISSFDIILRFLLRPKQSGMSLKLLNGKFAEAFKNELFHINDRSLKDRLIDDIFRNSLQALLRYEDKNSMRFSIEGRIPFLDFRLLEYVFRLPDKAIISYGWNKYILRKATEQILPSLINRRRNKIGFTTPEQEWFLDKQKDILTFLTGPRFEAKKYINQAEAVMAFHSFIRGDTDDTMMFWRVINLEFWLREFFPYVNSAPDKVQPKKINRAINSGGKTYIRFPVRTDVFEKGDDYVKKISNILLQSYKSIVTEHSEYTRKKWFAVISEKIVSVAQGRAYFIWDIHPGIAAKLLSGFVSRVPWGIGLGSPWTMELAIREVGLTRILFASIAGAIGKIIGKRGWFYKVAGRSAAGIDGPTEYSLYPANVSAKLLPKNPVEVCMRIDEVLQSSRKYLYSGSVIIDANDLGQNALGNTTGLPDYLVESIFRDNPMGQSDEQTPITIVFEV